MRIVSYAVYDVRTGEVVHLHSQPAGLEASVEEILQLVDPNGTRGLGAIQMPKEVRPDGGLRVVDGEVREVESSNTGAAGAEDGLAEPAVERRYEPHTGDSSTEDSV